MSKNLDTLASALANGRARVAASRFPRKVKKKAKKPAKAVRPQSVTGQTAVTFSGSKRSPTQHGYAVSDGATARFYFGIQGRASHAAIVTPLPRGVFKGSVTGRTLKAVSVDPHRESTLLAEKSELPWGASTATPGLQGYQRGADASSARLRNLRGEQRALADILAGALP
jgi:hypothetical protein